MECVRNGTEFALRSPKNGEVIRMTDARKLWVKILELRLQTGEPYIIFSDTVNNQMPSHQQRLGFKVRQSNLCSEIMLHTGLDHLGRDRTARVLPVLAQRREIPPSGKTTRPSSKTCSASSTTCSAISSDRAPDEMERAKYSAYRERSVGLRP